HHHAEEVPRGGRDAERLERMLAHVLARAVHPLVAHLEELLALRAERLDVLAEPPGRGGRRLGGAIDGLVRRLAVALDAFFHGALAAVALRFHGVLSLSGSNRATA